MIATLLTLLFAVVLVLINEWLWHKNLIRGEHARKSIHIIINVLLAFTPLYLSWTSIQVVCFVALVAFIAARYTGVIKSVYDVSRTSWGDIVGALAFLILAWFEPPRALFAAVVLHVAVADGVAALVGKHFGKGNSYKIFGASKSIAGTAAFYVSSLVIALGLVIFGGVGTLEHLWPVLLWLPVATTVAENVGVYGIDNILVPLATIAIFQYFV